MTMTVTESIITIAVVVLGTCLTRFLPFFVFPEGKEPPKFINYLGKVLPAAVTGMLVVYCFKGAGTAALHGLPELIAAVITGLIHAWKKNMLLSMALGTAVYMLLVNFIFIG